MKQLLKYCLYSLLLAIFIVNLNIENSYAGVTMTNFEATTLAFTKLELANIISDTCFATEIENYQFTGANATSFNNIRNELLSYLQNDSYNYVFYYYRYDSSYPGISPNVLEITLGTTAFTGGNYRDYVIHFQTEGTDYFYLSSSSRTGSPSKNGEISSVGRGKYYYANGTIYKSSQNVQDIAIELKYFNTIETQTNITIENQTIEAYNGQFNRVQQSLRIGNLNNYQYYINITPYYEYYTNNGWQNANNLINIETTNNYNVSIITTNTYYNILYRVYFIADGFQTTTTYYIFTEIGTISSGDINGNGNELIPIQNQINENNDFWKQTYNALFTLNSGDIDEIMTKLSQGMEELTSGDSPYAEEKEILESISSTEPGDFVISWGNVRYLNKDIIPSGEINFNQITEQWRTRRRTQNNKSNFNSILSIYTIKGSMENNMYNARNRNGTI